ncbi:TonB-dependent receptor [Croceibacterium sp. LX-88]|uniref:TonB-dependent receptor n=1 Tax=Croceibacterium selenioxidans TaxID=2838833 RepID=A0ABS5VZC2_9SPHN|nr:TonB-dependent receptor [Croceibacterium selenioxidans]MBT2132873.1 TonB-dependent receptor [Croceibacterium selenioxidans]
MKNNNHPSGASRRPRARASWLASAAALAAILPQAALAAEETTAATNTEAPATTVSEAPQGDIIIVTARNREESLVDVPIPISVISAATLEQQHVFTVADITQRAPGLTATTPNARRTGVSLRGIGKTSGNDNMEAAVGVIVDDVFLDHVGMTYQDFTDLAQVEILRGPQGTLLGKNTSLGVIKYTSKLPSFTPEGTLEVEGGLDRNTFKARGSFSDALIEDLLAFRASFFYDNQDGDILNVNPAVGGRWHEQNRWGGRFQLLLEPSDNFSLRLNVDGAETDERSNTKPFMVDPTTLNDGSVRTTTYSTRLARSYFQPYTPIIGSWDTIDIDEALPLVTRNYGGSLIATWDVGEVEIKSITAGRWFHFDATNDQEQTRFPIARSGSLVNTEQFSQEFRFTGDITDTIDYQAGLYLMRIETDTNGRSRFGRDAGAFFATNAQYNALNNPAGWLLLQEALDNTQSISNQHPISNSQAVFAQANWEITDRASLTAGLRYTREQKTSTTTKTIGTEDGSPLVSTGDPIADAIRAAQLQTPFETIIGEPIDDGAFAWLINPSYKITEDVLFYASASGGGKSGAVAFDNNGTRRNVAPEKTTDFELGVKGQFFDNVLWLSANLYYTKVRDYQAVTSIADTNSSTGFSSVLGNIPGIRAQGIEIDGTLTPFDGLTINFGGAYNDAVYTDWANATCPRAFPSSIPTCDNTGKQIVGAPKWVGIIGFNFEREVGSSGVSFYAYANDTYRSKHNLEQLLSPYGWQDSYHLTDAGIGIITEIAGARTQIGIAAKNLFDVQYTTSINDFSNNAPVGYDGIGPSRTINAVVRATF